MPEASNRRRFACRARRETHFQVVTVIDVESSFDDAEPLGDCGL
jgi:hypothetical protein